MTVAELAYLKCPDKIRANLINMGGPRLSIAEIERKLARLPTKVQGSHIGEPKLSDGVNYRVRGLLGPRSVARKSLAISPEKRTRIVELAKGIPDKPDKPKKPKKPIATYRYKGPAPIYGTAVYADGVIDRVCEALDLPREMFFSDSRKKYIVATRSLVVKVLRERNTAVYSYPRIAEIVGRKDHSTVIHSYQQFDNYCRLFPALTELLAELREGGE